MPRYPETSAGTHKRSPAMSRAHQQHRASAAAHYYRSRRVPERLEEALTDIYHRGPDDVYGHLSCYFAAFSDPPVISDVRGRKVLDGAGKTTLEAEISCTVQTVNKRVCAATVPMDAEPAPEVAGETQRQESVETAIRWIQESIGPALKGMEPGNQSTIDQLLRDYFKVMKQEDKEQEAENERAPSTPVSLPSPAPSPPSSKKKMSGKGKKAAALEKPLPPAEPPEVTTRGALAVAAVSLAVAKSSAALQGLPLYSHIAALKQQQPSSELMIPTPLISLLSCGKSSPGKLNLMKEILLIPRPGMTMAQSLDLAICLQTQIQKQLEAQSKGGSVTRMVSMLGCLVVACERLEQPLELVREACAALELELGRDVCLFINCAAHEIMDYNKGRYEIISGVWKSPDEMVDLYVDVVNKHPAIVALLDPFRKEDREQWEALGKAVGSKCYLIADVASRSGSAPTCSGPILRLTNETTVTDLLEAVQPMEEAKRLTIFGCSPEECVEESVVDLAVGLGVRFVSLGGLLRGERAAKYNRLLAIEEELTRTGTLGLRGEFEFSALENDTNILNSQDSI
ncbi:enolase 4 isoform X2 [Engystomops pustulosus]|uniref:enolase 4 isoform X2 n=1 Tax=Engystomops pustulosus TaxID=76066 RepID=UPI003AFAFC40